MRRFFRPPRDEDNSQISYLTAKCSRLAHENAVLGKDVLMTRERERSLQNDLEAVAAKLFQQEQINMEMRIKYNQLLSTVHREQGLVEVLCQRVHTVVEDSSRDAALLGVQLQQVSSDLLLLQSSEAWWRSCTAPPFTEPQTHEAQLHSKTCELEQLKQSYAQCSLELEEQRSAHQRKVQELEQENKGSLRKLQEMAEQFEWLCEQQRYWICCIKRFRVCLSEEKEALVLQVNRVEKEVAEFCKSPVNLSPDHTQRFSLEDTESRIPYWDADELTGLQAQVDKWRGLYEDLFNQLTSNQGGHAVDGYQKPP